MEHPVSLEFTFCVCDSARCLCDVWIRECKTSTGPPWFLDCCGRQLPCWLRCSIEVGGNGWGGRERLEEELVEGDYQMDEFCNEYGQCLRRSQ
jgi:hypothetical protein